MKVEITEQRRTAYGTFVVGWYKGNRYSKTYYGYTKREYLKLFRQFCKESHEKGLTDTSVYIL